MARENAGSSVTKMRRAKSAPTTTLNASTSTAVFHGISPSKKEVIEPAHVAWRFNEFAERDNRQMEEFKGTLRGTVRDWLLPYVNSGSHTLRFLQEDLGLSTNAWNRVFWNRVSLLGTHEFYMIVFPFLWFVLNRGHLACQLLNLLAASIFLGNWVKDWTCLPRPLPPARVCSDHGGVEYGFVSTHATMSVTVPVYVAAYFSTPDNWWWLMGLAAFYGIFVASSRIWMGMHTPVDVIGGLALGFAVLAAWFAGVESLIDFILSYSDSWTVLLLPVCLSVFCLWSHPDPLRYCPCLEDSSALLGAASGCLVGSWRRDFVWGFAIETYVTTAWYHTVARFVLGSAVMFGSRAIMKSLFFRLLPAMYSWGLPRRRWLGKYSPTEMQRKAAKMPPSSSSGRFIFPEVPLKLQALQAQFADGHIWDVDIPARVLVYFCFAWISTEFPVPVFLLFGLG